MHSTAQCRDRSGLSDFISSRQVALHRETWRSSMLVVTVLPEGGCDPELSVEAAELWSPGCMPNLWVLQNCRCALINLQWVRQEHLGAENYSGQRHMVQTPLSCMPISGHNFPFSSSSFLMGLEVWSLSLWNLWCR